MDAGSTSVRADPLRQALAAIRGRARPAPLKLGATARRLSRYLKPYTLAVVLGVGAFFASAAIDPLLPALFKQLIDNGFKPGGELPVALVPVAIIGLFAVRGLLAFA